MCASEDRLASRLRAEPSGLVEGEGSRRVSTNSCRPRRAEGEDRSMFQSFGFRISQRVHAGRTGGRDRHHRRARRVRRAAVSQVGGAGEGRGGVLLSLRHPRRPGALSRPSKAPTPATSPPWTSSSRRRRTSRVGTVRRGLDEQLQNSWTLDAHPHRHVVRLRRIHRHLHRRGLRHAQQHDHRHAGHQSDGHQRHQRRRPHDQFAARRPHGVDATMLRAAARMGRPLFSARMRGGRSLQ